MSQTRFQNVVGESEAPVRDHRAGGHAQGKKIVLTVQHVGLQEVIQEELTLKLWKCDPHSDH